jgi:death-on-curing family protein
MSNIQYPSRKDLDFWIEYLSWTPKEGDKNIFRDTLKRYLPRTNTEWKERVMDIVALICQDFYQPVDVHHKAALIFYKINKGHNYIDGNKRSSIIVTYLFYVLNDFFLSDAEGIRTFAKKIARSKGRRYENNWIKKTEAFLRERAYVI